MMGWIKGLIAAVFKNQKRRKKSEGDDTNYPLY